MSYKETAPATTQWVLPQGVHTPAVDAGAVSMFCLPPAGMGAWVYQKWSQTLAPHVKVYPVELPGHGSRMREARITNLCELSVAAVDALEPLFRQGSYALFGHSMGAWIAWEMLQETTRRGLPLPVWLFASGNRAPSLHEAQHDVDPVRMHTLSPDQFWPHFRLRYGDNKHLEDAAMQAFTYPMLRDDFKLVETYQPSNTPNTKTTVPITAIGGAMDTRYTRDQVSAWSRHTSGGFSEVWLDNQGHNYIADCPHSLITALKAALSPVPMPKPQLQPAAPLTGARPAAKQRLKPAETAALPLAADTAPDAAGKVSDVPSPSRRPAWCCCG